MVIECHWMHPKDILLQTEAPSVSTQMPDVRVDRESDTPLYVQIRDQIRHGLEDALVAAGTHGKCIAIGRGSTDTELHPVEIDGLSGNIRTPSRYRGSGIAQVGHTVCRHSRHDTKSQLVIVPGQQRGIGHVAEICHRGSEIGSTALDDEGTIAVLYPHEQIRAALAGWHLSRGIHLYLAQSIVPHVGHTCRSVDERLRLGLETGEEVVAYAISAVGQPNQRLQSARQCVLLFPR